MERRGRFFRRRNASETFIVSWSVVEAIHALSILPSAGNRSDFQPGCGAGSRGTSRAGSYTESAGDPGCRQLAGEQSQPDGRAIDGCGAAAGLRPGLHCAGELPRCAADDGGQHRRLCRDRAGRDVEPGGGVGFHSAIARPGLCGGHSAIEWAADGRGAAGATTDLFNSAGESGCGVCTGIRSGDGVRGAGHGIDCWYIPDLVWSGDWHWSLDREQPAVGMGRMGMELGTRHLLQPLYLGRMAWRVSTAARVVSPAANHLEEPAWIWRQLALPAAKLPATTARSSASGAAACDSAPGRAPAL